MIEIPKKEPLNIVPFIDIMLVLLAMVLSISTFIAKGEIAINLPEAETAAPAPKTPPREMKLQVNAAGKVFIDGAEASPSELERLISGLTDADHVTLSVDRDAKFENFVSLVDLLKKHHHENFTIATARKSGS
ncbi:TonB system transport protein ExbD [Mesosutterella sp. AGMB02718]|uniref:Biopolymer transport protein ExbD n=1 Tax=Mesosutterella faecium TaxID=2925194 RepID=A0ABT7INY0_9BURK|nr:TonB system transport protein ExbD [Mesosutterella sp. AGMB02718]MDL2060083.1 TonB system transport protein ExbD [Mesosutterella sp. AGMB02718]